MHVPVTEAFYNGVNSNCYEFIRLPNQNYSDLFIQVKNQREIQRNSTVNTVHLLKHLLSTSRAGMVTARLRSKDLGSSHLKDSRRQKCQ